MANVTLELPAMYADHHVVEVRRLLLELPGVSDVIASSCFGTVEVTYDSAQLDPEVIRTRLDEAGYIGELMAPTEVEPDMPGNTTSEFQRHTAVYEQTRKAVSFGQNVAYMGRPLWPCPGMGLIRTMEE
jgi:copper chaperone CopZ